MHQADHKVVQQQLARWCEHFAAALGDSVLSLVLYGGLAKNEFIPGQSDVNVLIVFRTVNAAVLDQAAPFLRQGAFEFGLAPMLLTSEDLHDSADIFPIKFLDMQRRHQVLFGPDPFAKVTVPRHHLRLRCQQELRNLSLRLRQSYIRQFDRPELLQAALNRAVSSLLLNLGVLLELKTGQAAETKQASLINAAALGISLEPVQQAWAIKNGALKPEPAGLRKIFGAFMDTVHQAAEMAGRTS